MVNGKEILNDSGLALEGWNSTQSQESGVRDSQHMSWGSYLQNDLAELASSLSDFFCPDLS